VRVKHTVARAEVRERPSRASNAVDRASVVTRVATDRRIREAVEAAA